MSPAANPWPSACSPPAATSPSSFRHELPARWHGYRVIDATKHDARYLDDPGTVAGLLALGGARKDTSGFVQDSDEAADVEPEEVAGEERRRGFSILRSRNRHDRRAGRRWVS